MGTLKQVRRRWATLIAVVAAIAVILVWLNPPIPRNVQGNPDLYFRVTPVAEYVPWGTEPVEFYVNETMQSMSIEQKVRSLLVVNQPGLDPGALQAFVDMNQLGGFILMGSNIPATQEELTVITAALRGSPELPRLVAIDEEGGEVKRLPYDTFAGADVLRNEPVESTTNAFFSRAELLNSLGINLNFGIVADVSADPASFIYGRTFGSDGASAGSRVAAAVGAENGKVLSTLKHFPGHGSAPGDSHVGIPTSSLNLDQWSTTDAVPFDEGITADAAMVMFGHLSFPEIDTLPASLSQQWHAILRDRLGFDGVIITDDMTMLEGSKLPEYSDPAHNAVLALQAGNDVLLYVPSVNFDINSVVNALVAAVENGAYSQESLDESVRRVLTLRRELYPEAQSWMPPCDERCFIWARY